MHTRACAGQTTASGVIPQMIPTLKLYLLIIVVVCVQCRGGVACIIVCDTHVEVRGQFCGVSSVFKALCGFWRSNS